MSEYKTEVQLGADTKPLEEGVQNAEKALSSSFAKMKADLAGLTTSTKSEVDKMNTQFGQLGNAVTDSFRTITRGFAMVTAALAGGAAFSKAISESARFTGEANKLGKQLGITATEASELQVALNMVGLSGDEYAEAAQHVTRQLKKNETGLNDMGVATRNAKGEHLSMQQIIDNGIKVLQGYNEGTDQMLAGQAIFGRGAASALALAKLDNAAKEKGAETARKLGLVIGQENVQALKEYKAAMSESKEVVNAVWKAVGDALMPILTELGEWFATVGPAAVTIFKGVFGGLAALFWGFKNAIMVVVDALKGFVTITGMAVEHLSDAFGKLLNGDWAGAKASMANIGKGLSEAWDKTLGEMAKDSEDAQKKIMNLFADPTAIVGKKKTKKTFNDDDGENKDKTEKTRVPLWEAQLREYEIIQSEKAAAEGKFFSMSSQAEADYWKQKVGLTKAGTQENIAARAKLAEADKKVLQERYDAEVAGYAAGEAAAKNNLAAKAKYAEAELLIAKQMYGAKSKQAIEASTKLMAVEQEQVAQAKTIAGLREQADREAAIADIETAERTAQAQFGIQQITQDRLIALQKQFEEQKFAISKTALDKELTQVDPQSDPVEYQKRLNDILKLKIQHDAKMQQITLQGVKADDSVWKGMFTSIGNSFEQLAQQFAKGGMTIKSLFAQMGQAILSTMVGVFTKIAVEEATMRVKSLLGMKVEGAATVQTEAAKAGAGGIASMAAAPFPLNLSAPAFGAEMFGLASAFSIPAASGGFDIPAGVNPLTQLHQSEMVLPANIADPLRQSISSGNVGMGSGGATNITIHALDAKSVADYFRKNSSTLAPGLRGIFRNATPVMV
jgi:hypothetical protein